MAGTLLHRLAGYATCVSVAFAAVAWRRCTTKQCDARFVCVNPDLIEVT